MPPASLLLEILKFGVASLWQFVGRAFSFGALRKAFPEYSPVTPLLACGPSCLVLTAFHVDPVPRSIKVNMEPEISLHSSNYMCFLGDSVHG